MGATFLDIQQAIARAVAYLESVQHVDGGFVSFSSPATKPFQPTKEYRTTFVPALILAALIQVEGTESMRSKLQAYLLNQRSATWTFNYWAQDATERQSLPYPDDLDDTFCALIALHKQDPSCIDGAALAQVVQLLVAVETKPGGPYKTWLVDSQASKIWQDVDLAVNANVAYFLKQIDSPLQQLEDFLGQAIQTNQLTSPYYPSIFPVVYYVARAYTGEFTLQLRSQITQMQKDGHWHTPLQTALAMSALHALGQKGGAAQALDFMLASQQADGSWPAEAYCIDPVREGKQHYHGSAGLVTAFVLEALQIFLVRPLPIKQKDLHVGDQVADQLYTKIAQRAFLELDSLDTELKEQSRTFLKRLFGSTSNREIVLLPYFFQLSLRSPEALGAELFIQLGLANVYGWMAYTIYDDFLDDEGNPLLLSSANVALRTSLRNFRKSVPDPKYLAYVASIFDTIDGANAWEVSNCRFAVQSGVILIKDLPYYGDRLRLAERSLGHILTPVGVLVASGVSLDDSVVREFEKAFSQYLIARQISDDLHDWERDVRKGHISYVVTAILQDLGLRSGEHTITQLTSLMQQQFWGHTLLVLCKQVQQHVALAREALPDIVKPESAIASLLDKIDQTITDTLRQQAEAASFLDAYQ